MAIGEFGGAPAVPGDNGILAVDAALLVLRDESCGAQSVAGVGRRHAAVFQKSGQSAVVHHLRQIGRRGLRIIRALDAPLRPPGMAHRFDAGRRRARADPHFHRLGTAVLQAHPFRTRVRAAAEAAAAAASDRRADVGPLCIAVARHRRGVSAQPRRLRHRLGRCAHGAAVGGTLRSRRLHRLRDFDPACARRRHVSIVAVCQPSVPVIAAVALMEADDDPYVPTCDGADGRTDRHAGQSDRREQPCRRSAASIGSAPTSSPRCRFPIPASCATSIPAFSSSTAS